MKQVRVIKTVIEEGRETSREMNLPQDVWDRIRKETPSNVKYELVKSKDAPAPVSLANLPVKEDGTPDYEKYSDEELKAAGKGNEIKGYANMKRETLIEKLTAL